jgi:uridylate kinase
LATLMNALALRDVFESQGVVARVMSAVAVPTGIAEHHDSRRALRHLSRGRVVIFAGGTGNPYFTTDSAASLRGIEIGAEIIFKATQVDGVYDADPRRFPEATRFQTLTYDDVIHQNLQVMDLTAICLCRDNNIPLCVFGFEQPGILKRIMMGSKEGTLIRS